MKSGASIVVSKARTAVDEAFATLFIELVLRSGDRIVASKARTVAPLFCTITFRLLVLLFDFYTIFLRDGMLVVS